MEIFTKDGEKLNELRGSMSREERKTTYEEIRLSSSPSPSFYMLVCISTIIASYGLLAGSTAVVIGAMLVAPLMGPIFGIALGLSNGDNTLLKSALLSEFIGIILAIGLAYIIGMLPLRPEFGPEIIARTQPTVYDIIIALTSGLAGAYALVHKRISPALPGVAIATALVPPLATCGLCLAAHNYQLALGALLLFSANLIAIEFAAASVYAIAGLIGFDKRNGSLFTTFLKRFGVSCIILTIMAVFLTNTLVQVYNERALGDQLRLLVSEQVKTTLGASLSELRYEKQGENLQVMAVVMTPRELSSRNVAEIEQAIQQHIEPNAYLIVRSLISRDADRNGQVFISKSEQQILNQQLTINELQSKTIQILNEELARIPGALIDNVSIQKMQDNNPVIMVEVSAPTPIDPQHVAVLQDKLNLQLEKPIRLIVRSISTQIADDNRYLFEEELEPLSGEDLEFHNKLEKAIKDQLYRQKPAGKLLDFHYGAKEDYLLVLMQVRTPEIMSPTDVRIMEQALQEQIDENIRVIIRCSVGVDASSDYYLRGYDENLPQALR